MKKLTITIILCVIASKMFASIEVKNLKSVKVDLNAPIKAKLLKNSSNLEGVFEGIANIEKEEIEEKEKGKKEKEEQVIIKWNNFKDKSDNVVDLSNANITSEVFINSDNLKMGTKLVIQGDLSILSQSINGLNLQKGKGEEKKEKQKYVPLKSGGGSKGATKGDFKVEEIKPLEKEKSAANCEPLWDFKAGTAQIFEEEFYVKKDGSKVVTKNCYPTHEKVSIQWEECSFIHEFDKKQSYRQAKAYVMSQGGMKSSHCSVKGEAIPHQYDDSKCKILNPTPNIAIMQSKTYIQVEGKKHFITDCQPIASKDIKIDMRGCKSSLYNVVKDSYQVYPAGKRYVEEEGKREYLDKSCKVLIELGKSWKIRFHRYEYHDGGREVGFSKEVHMYFYDFSEYEGGVKKDIEEYVINVTYPHVKVNEWSGYGDGCGRNKVGRRKKYWNTYITWKRIDGTEYTRKVDSWCRNN